MVNNISNLSFIKFKGLGESDVSFYLFDTPDNLNFVKLTSENTDVLNNKKGKITFIIHGWTQSRNEKWYKLLTNILLKKTSENQRVIQVDWSGPAAEVYPKAAYNTKTVGNNRMLKLNLS